jgi:multisubunit Na+/H+ antiporter MnhC subunit
MRGEGVTVWIDVVQIVLIGATIALALLTLETRDLVHAVIGLCGLSLPITLHAYRQYRTIDVRELRRLRR